MPRLFPTLVPRTAAALIALAVALSLLAVDARPAHAEPRLTVTPATDLDPAGQRVRVHGEGYDEFKGVYVAWCVVPPAGEKPGPCGGGEDRDGSSGGSVWVSSNPPMYGLGLAQPYDGSGGFDVEIVVSRTIATEDGDIDCFTTPCAVVTRNDHERTDDRSQDVFASVSFTGQQDGDEQAPPSATPTTGPTDEASPSAPAASPPAAEQTTPPPSSTPPGSPSSTTSPAPVVPAATPTANPAAPGAGDDAVAPAPVASDRSPTDAATRDVATTRPSRSPVAADDGTRSSPASGGSAPMTDATELAAGVPTAVSGGADRLWPLVAVALALLAVTAGALVRFRRRWTS